MNTTWRVGEVAETSGLTVRTLHHWDSIGLLTPSRRGPGGHREYTDDDLGRLYLILTLRGLGLSLEEIGDCLDTGVDLAELLATHLAQIDEMTTALQEVRNRVVRLSELVADESDRTPALIDVLQAMHRLSPHSQTALEQHLDAEQLDALQKGSAAVGSARHYLHRIVWPHLYRRVDELRRAGKPPEDALVQHLVARMAQLSAPPPAVERTSRAVCAPPGTTTRPAYLDMATRRRRVAGSCRVRRAGAYGP